MAALDDSKIDLEQAVFLRKLKYDAKPKQEAGTQENPLLIANDNHLATRLR